MMRKAIAGHIFMALFLIMPTSAYSRHPSPLSLSLTPPATGGAAGRFESEHRPSPVRTYWVNDPALSSDAAAYVLRPDNTLDKVKLKKNAQGVNLTFKTPLGNGPMHGVHNVYVMDTAVSDDCLVVRAAKWMTIHHNCGWGHDHRFDAERNRAKCSKAIPLEISCTGLWDGNYHAAVSAGDKLTFTVFHHGTPVQGAAIRLITGSGWAKELKTDLTGNASFQLIRDYYPDKWSGFNREAKTRFMAVAEYSINESKDFPGQKYQKTRYVATLPWTYVPSAKDYSSYQAGLFVGILTLGVSGAGIYIFRARRKKPFREITFHE